MRTIRKGPEPRELTEYRQSQGSSYDDYPHKDALRKRLVAEQRGLWNSKRKSRLNTGSHSARKIYSLSSAICSQAVQAAKADRDLCRNPADPAHNVGAIVWFENDGRIRSTNRVLDDELNTVLNLNAKHIVDDRKQALRAFRSLWRLRPTKELRRQLDRLRDDSGVTQLPAYCQVIFLWLERQIANRPAF